MREVSQIECNDGLKYPLIFVRGFDMGNSYMLMVKDKLGGRALSIAKFPPHEALRKAIKELTRNYTPFPPTRIES